MNNFTMKSKQKEYQISYATIHKRLFSYVFDYLCILSICAVTISIVADDQLQEYKKLLKNSRMETIREINLTLTGNERQDISLDEESDEERNKKNEDKQKEIIRNLATSRKVRFCSLFIMFSYYIFFMITKQQATPGQRFFNLMTVRFDGKKMNLMDVVNRICLLLIFNILAFVCLFTKNNLAIHDYLSKTMVIEIK